MPKILKTHPHSAPSVGYLPLFSSHQNIKYPFTTSPLVLPTSLILLCPPTESIRYLLVGDPAVCLILNHFSGLNYFHN